MSTRWRRSMTCKDSACPQLLLPWATSTYHRMHTPRFSAAVWWSCSWCLALLSQCGHACLAGSAVANACADMSCCAPQRQRLDATSVGRAC